MSDFLSYVAEWHSLQQQIEAAKAAMKPLVDKELKMRKALGESIATALGDKLKEGVNHYPLEDGRSLKFTYAVDRAVVEADIAPTREAYLLQNDRPVDFDALLRVKYELNKRDYDKLSPEAKLIVSRMLTTKPKAPTIEMEG